MHYDTRYWQFYIISHIFNLQLTHSPRWNFNCKYSSAKLSYYCNLIIDTPGLLYKLVFVFMIFITEYYHDVDGIIVKYFFPLLKDKFHDLPIAKACNVESNTRREHKSFLSHSIMEMIFFSSSI